MLIQLVMNVYTHFAAMTLDVKEAFLMSPQPVEENAYAQVDGRIFKLLLRLPGQRTAAFQWFQLFAGTCSEFLARVKIQCNLRCCLSWENRCDQKQYDSFQKDVDLFSKVLKTPARITVLQ